MDPHSAKNELRQAIAQRLQKLSPKDRAAESRSLCRRVLEALKGVTGSVCLFYPMGDEADVKELLTELPTRGIAVYLPRKEGLHFVFRKMTNADALKPDEFGIPAPAASDPLLDAKDVAVALIPGRAYDQKGNRMGRGNGGYDRWIRDQRKLNPATKFWGVCFECQVVSEVPMEEHDERVDGIMTARGLVMVKR